MKNSQLLTLIRETKLSPEQMAKRIKVSNMTVRRWMEKPPSMEISHNHSRAIEDAVSGLIGDGILAPTSEIARQIIEGGDSSSFQDAIRSLGLPKDFYASKDRDDTDSLIMGLSKIGGDENRSLEVINSVKKIKKYKGPGEEWPKRIKILLSVILSKSMISVV